MSDWTGMGFLIVFAGSAAIGVGRKVIERRRARRALRTKSLLDARSREGEVVRVTGIVKPGPRLLEAPLSGKPCVVFRSRVRDGKSFVSLAKTPHEQIEMVPFILDCGDREVAIEGVHAMLDLAPLDLPRRKINAKRREQFLIFVGLPLRETSRGYFDETIVEPGQRVSVAGLVMKDLVDAPPLDERGFREEPQRHCASRATTITRSWSARRSIDAGAPRHPHATALSRSR